MAVLDPYMRNVVPIIDQELCDGCGCCLDACVFGVIALMHGKAMIVRPDRCESEGACAEICPLFAISMVIG